MGHLGSPRRTCSACALGYSRAHGRTSTDLAHHVRKLERTRRLESLALYLVFDQKAPAVRVWPEGPQAWPATAVLVEGFGAAIDVAEIGATIRLADVYRRPQPDSRRR